MKKKITTIISLVIIWLFISLSIGKEVILPSPIDVFLRMIEMLMNIFFYSTIFTSLIRVVITVTISALFAFALAYLAYQNKTVDELLTPIISLLQSIPTMSYVILSLVWTGSIQTVYIILTLVVFPLLYHNFLQGYKSIDREYRDLILLYNPPLMYKMFCIYLPLIKGSLLSGISNALNLGAKVSVMAEILAQVPNGIGRAIHYCHIDFDMIGVFAWTLWLVIIVLFFDFLINKYINRF